MTPYRRLSTKVPEGYVDGPSWWQRVHHAVTGHLDLDHTLTRHYTIRRCWVCGRVKTALTPFAQDCVDAYEDPASWDHEAGDTEMLEYDVALGKQIKEEIAAELARISDFPRWK